METVTQKKINELSTYKKRVEILIGARFRDTNTISSAKNVQDKLRKKIGSWRGADEIKKWRMRAS